MSIKKLTKDTGNYMKPVICGVLGATLLMFGFIFISLLNGGAQESAFINNALMVFAIEGILLLLWGAVQAGDNGWVCFLFILYGIVQAVTAVILFNNSLALGTAAILFGSAALIKCALYLLRGFVVKASAVAKAFALIVSASCFGSAMLFYGSDIKAALIVYGVIVGLLIFFFAFTLIPSDSPARKR